MGRHGDRILIIALIALIGLMAIGSGGCTDDSTDGSSRSDSTDLFTEGRAEFDDLELVPGSTPFGDVTAKDGIVTRSYEVTGTTPAEIIAFYETALAEDGWAPSQPLHRSDSAGRADWLRDNFRLELSAVEIGAEAAGRVRSQYSLTLRPT